MYNAGVVAANSKVVGLAPELGFKKSTGTLVSKKRCSGKGKYAGDYRNKACVFFFSKRGSKSADNAIIWRNS
jgi:hypothetical protein